MVAKSCTAAITCNAVLSPAHLSVCGKSQEHSTPGLVMFGHSQAASKKVDGDGVEDRIFGMLSFFAVKVDDDTFVSTAIVVRPNVLVVVCNISAVVVMTSSVALKHDAVIINNTKTSKSRNSLGILEKDICLYVSLLYKNF